MMTARRIVQTLGGPKVVKAATLEDAIDAGRETSWMTDKLVFQDEPMSKVVAELNRYSEKKIVIDDASRLKIFEGNARKVYARLRTSRSRLPSPAAKPSTTSAAKDFAPKGRLW